VFVRSFVYSEINTFGLPILSKISFAFNIFVPIPVQEMAYLKAIQKITPMHVSVSGTIDRKNVYEIFRGVSAPLAPLWIRLCKEWYNKSSRTWSELQPRDVVRVQPNKRNEQWSLVTVIKRVTPRSHLVKDNGRVFRRNRKSLRLTKERYVTDFDDSFDSIFGRNLRNDVNADSPQRSFESDLNCGIPVPCEPSINAKRTRTRAIRPL